MTSKPKRNSRELEFEDEQEVERPIDQLARLSGCFPWGCLGSVLTAIVTGIFLIISILIKVPDPSGKSQPILLSFMQPIFAIQGIYLTPVFITPPVYIIRDEFPDTPSPVPPSITDFPTVTRTIAPPSPIPSSTPTETPTPSPQPSSVPPTPNSRSCPDTVSREVVEPWRSGEVDNADIVDEHIDEFNARRRMGGNYDQGDTIPAGVVIAMSFNEAGVLWSDYPLIPVVYYRNWGLFETTDEFITPWEGACISISPPSSVVTTPNSQTALQLGNCDFSQTLPLYIDNPPTDNSPLLLPEWKNPNATQLHVLIPDGYDSVWISSDPGIFNGRSVNTRVALVSEINLTIENVSFNFSVQPNHFNIWVVAFENCTAQEIFSNLTYGFDGAPTAFVIDENGQFSSIAVP
jgi:hypothetical protein